jgi:type IV secretory pathway VirD2 relaxase
MYMRAYEFLIEAKPKPTNPKLWRASLARAREKFSVYPSAYANAWAAKDYKSRGGKWRMGEK